LNNWRSDIGKFGYNVVLDMWADSSEFNCAEDRAEHVAKIVPTFQFVFKNPDAAVSQLLHFATITTNQSNVARRTWTILLPTDLKGVCGTPSEDICSGAGASAGLGLGTGTPDRWACARGCCSTSYTSTTLPQ